MMYQKVSSVNSLLTLLLKIKKFRAIRAVTPYRNDMLELIDNIEDMIMSSNHGTDCAKEEMIMEIKTENKILKDLVVE